MAYSLNGVYELLHRLNLSVLKHRSKHRQADLKAQQRWLESAPFLSSVSATNTPVGGLRCGSRTKSASASKGG